ncbi:MAG: hypothetical protein NT062_32845 [Proteobacteria bacterium]|nr:hypothetical protein [Pseudomonadota bacterium]
MAYRAVLTEPAEAREALIRLWTENLPVHGDLKAKHRWFYEDNPAGKGEAFLLFADDGPAIGCAGLAPRTLAYDGVVARGALLADFAIDKHHRSGLPAIVLQRAVKRHIEATYALSYGYPNAHAVAIHKRTGYHELGQMGRYVRVLRFGPYIQKRFGWDLRSRLGGAIVDRAVATASRARALPGARTQRLAWVADVDARFDRLWERADRSLVACPRTSEFLRWRFLRKPTEHNAIAILHERAGGALLAYAVVRGDAGGPAELVDLFGTGPEALDALLGQLAPALYARGHTTVEFRYLGHPWVRDVLAKHWFSLRNVDRSVIISVATSSPIPREVLCNPNAWYMTELDEDT